MIYHLCFKPQHNRKNMQTQISGLVERIFWKNMLVPKPFQNVKQPIISLITFHKIIIHCLITKNSFLYSHVEFIHSINH